MLSKPWLNVVGRQQGRDIDLERQQVPDGVGVLGAIQPMEDGTAGIRPGQRRPVKRGRQITRQPRQHRRLRPRDADRGHGACTDLPDDLLPDLRVSGRVGNISRLERQACCWSAVVMASDTVPVNQGARRGGIDCRGRSGSRCHRRRLRLRGTTDIATDQTAKVITTTRPIRVVRRRAFSMRAPFCTER